MKFAKYLFLLSYLSAPGSYASDPFDRFLVSPGTQSSIANAVAASLGGSDRRGNDGPMKKAGPDLTLLFHEYRDHKARLGKTAVEKPFIPSNRLIRTSDDTVIVDIAAEANTDAVVRELQALGMKDIAVFGRVISGRLPIMAIDRAAAIKDLRFARPAYAGRRTGSVTSQGDAALAANTARTTYGVDGAGITIGTLSDSYDCLGGAAGDVSSSDLPTGVVVLQELTGCGGAIDEGRAMMQIIHDVAPGADQAFHSAFLGQADFANGILELASVTGADIINDDIIYFAEPMFQDGIIAQAIDTVQATGVAYFSSAGNSGRDSYEDSYRNSGTPGYRAGSIRHDFDPGPGTDALQQVTIPGGARVIFVLQWDDPYFSVSGAPGADTDMDIVLYSKNGVAQAGSISPNIGGDPVEAFEFITKPGPAKNYHITIDHVAGPAPAKLKYVFFGNMTIGEYGTASPTVYGHANAAGARAVGAARYDATPAFGTSPPQLEPFSSAGGIPILFDVSGNPVNIIRQKPEIVAPDGGDNTFFGNDYEGNGWPNFFGTSAAAPHAAAVAGLLLELDGRLSPDSLYTTLQMTTIDMGPSGFDNDTGFGLVQADLALAALDSDADGILNDLDNCPNDANPFQEDNEEDGLGDACDADDDNDTLTDILETGTYGTNPLLADTDSDGFDDAAEITAGSDPLVATSIPGSSSGDINGDNVVNLTDLILGYRIILGLYTASTNEMLRGDVAPLSGGAPAPDAAFTSGDVLIIQRKVLGEISF